MADQLIDALERAREGYDTERDWCSFLLDSYTGGGGYQGTIRQPDVGWWGAAAERYAPWSSSRADGGSLSRNYLDRYPREDEAKFKARLAVSHLWNFVGPLTDLKTSYLLRKGLTYQNAPDAITEWHQDVDGAGTSWDELRPLVALMAAIFGWLPVQVDMDPAQPGESVAQAEARGAGRPRAIPLTPGNLVDYSHDGKRFEWAKVRTDHVERPAWNAPPVKVSVYRIWTPESVEVYEVREVEGKDKSARAVSVGPHPFGQVPISVFKHSACPGDPVRGLPMHAGPARAQKRLYNLLSELDEHMRAQVFAVLVLVMKGEVGGEVQLGADNAIPLDPEARNQHYFMAPPGTVAETYERRIEATIREGIYRAARVEFSRPTGQSTSGVARAYEFAQTNRAIADFAAELARGERWMDGIAARALGVSDDAMAEYTISAPDDFGIEDLAQELENVTAALTMGLGATMEARLRMRVAERLDPQMPPEVRKTVEAELEEIVEQAAADRAMARELAAAAVEDDPEDDLEDENQDDRAA